ncbi:MAG: tail fiber protein [Rhizobacter sp.]|nr:tail fiber protein [Ferruginibacter sp.]
MSYIIATGGIFPPQSGGTPAYSNTIIGEIRLFAGSFAPLGFMFCHGQLLSLNNNLSLFSVLGTTYGGNGTTHFALPDLRGAVPVGFGAPATGASWLRGEVN